MEISPNNIRKISLEMIHNSKSGHVGGSFSIAEIVSYLYNNYDLSSGQEDKLILSKGHAVPAIYAALHLSGVISKEEILTFREIDSRLQGHPDKVRLPNVVATTGSLGQGLSIAIGHALSHKIKDNNQKVFCIVGDGEMQEGQVWESIMLAPKFKLDNLYFIIDSNGAQNDGNVEDILSLNIGKSIKDKIESFGWNTTVVDGHNVSEIDLAVKNISENIPNCIIANTTKGKGVSFMETYEWHAKAPNDREFELAIEELSR
jgi:transketolase